MTAATTILLGPARAGKTTRLLARYRDQLAAPAGGAGIGRGLWIGPTHRAVESVREQLVVAGVTGCLAPNCFTFSRFAEAIIESSPASNRPLTAFEKRQLIRRLIEQAIAAERLAYFRPIAHTEGLIDLVAELFSDLKRQEIWPDEFNRICNTLGNRPKDCELADLYERYQLLLNEQRWYDSEGRFWSARDLLGQGQIDPFQDVNLVIVDGFADFTRTQQEILALLHGRVAEMLISLPLEEGRPDLFHKPAKTLAELERRLPGARRETVSRRRIQRSPPFSCTIRHIEQQIFRDPRRIEPSSLAEGLTILAASGQLGEVEMVARTIKRLLVDGDSEHRTRVQPGDIAVVVRSTADVGPLVHEVFAEYGLPYYLDGTTSVARSPLVSAFIDVLKLDREDWPFRQLLKLLANNYFQPEWPQWLQGAAAVDVEQAVRALQIPKGRRALLAALSRLANAKLDDRASDGQRRRQSQSAAALEVFTRLAEAFDRLPVSATAAEWSVAFDAFATELGMLAVARRPCDLPIARQDAGAWDQLRAALDVSETLENQIDHTPARLDRRAILQTIADICATEGLPHEYDDIGRVRILAAQNARALDVPYLFMAGLSEKAFPAADRDDRLYSAADHGQMNRAGSRFVERHERACEEMLLFYEVITRARRRLWLSYSALDESAQPLAPSPYLVEVQRLFVSDAVRPANDPNLSPIPAESDPLCVRDFRIKAVSMALDGSPRLAGQLLQQERHRQSTASLLAAIRATAERSARERFGAFEGVLLGAAAQQRLTGDFGPDHCWSTSQLEEYGYCPHQFFLRRVLGLRELQDLSLEVDYFRRGRRLHTLLTNIHRQLNETRGPCSPSECAADEFERLVQETLAAVMQNTASDTALDLAFDEIDNRLIARWIQQYLDQYLKYDKAFHDCDEPPRPAHFEVAFGPAKDNDDGDALDPLSQPVAYELTCGGTSIRLAGRVDRIDIGLIDGQVVFNVLDYKSSPAKQHRIHNILDGSKLQLPLYAMVVQDLLLADQEAIPWHGGYWHVRDGGFNPKQSLAFHERTPNGIRRTELWAELRERLVERVGRLVAGIRQGQFPMHCEDDDCTGRCAFKTVCRVHAARSLEKTWQPPPIHAE